MEEGLKDFRNKVKKVNGPRKHSVTHSHGVYDVYKHVRKNGWYDIGKPVSESDYYKVIRYMNKAVADSILKGYSVNLPCKMGCLEVRKSKPKIAIEDGKLVTSLPVDWSRTLQLWYEDEEAYSKKMLVRCESRELFRVFYDRSNADYRNKCYYEFRVNREVKLRMRDLVKAGRLDAVFE